MNGLTDRDFQEYLKQIEQYHITIPIENGETKFIKLENIETPPIRRVPMKAANLEEQILFMPRDIVGKLITRIGSVWDALFAKEKI